MKYLAFTTCLTICCVVPSGSVLAAERQNLRDAAAVLSSVQQNVQTLGLPIAQAKQRAVPSEEFMQAIEEWLESWGASHADIGTHEQ